VTDLACKDYFTVREAAAYAGISYSQWRARIQPNFPPGEFFGVKIYRRTDVARRFDPEFLDQRRIRRLDLDRKRRHANPARFAAKRAARRAAKSQRTPVWADHDAILAIYRECECRQRLTGIPHHVDHVAPLQGRTISGLHVEYNLQILTGPQNCSKGNRW
jgi:5-methylcytosine-specific restriction endonuclease McrA